MSASPIAPHPFDQPLVLDPDEMHRLKNTPLSVPDWLMAKLQDAARNYRFQPFPSAMYGEWTEDRKRTAVMQECVKRGLSYSKPDDRDMAERYLPEYDSRLIHSEQERQDWIAKGWAPEPTGVKASKNAYEEAIAYAAAVRAKDDLKLGEKAKAELEAAEDAAEDHVLDVQPGPKRGPGRPRAVTA